jgi:hypothetical protein
VFGDLLAGEPLTRDRKQVLAQFFGIQMVRGPAFVEQRAELIGELISGLEAKDLKPGCSVKLTVI